MTKEELKQYIDDNIYENPDGDITGEGLNEVLKAIVDDAGTKVEANPTGTPTETMQTIKIGETIYTAPQGPQGEPGAPGPANTLTIGTVQEGEQAAANITGEAPNQQLNLTLPKGEQGDPGQNAVNPFKGWFTNDNIPTTGQAGDYCNVSDTSTTPPTVTIYRWNTTTNQFEDTGEVPDTATGETFANGETLQEVAIDESHLNGPINSADATKPVLADAKDVVPLKQLLRGFDLQEVRQSFTVEAQYIKPDGSLSTGSTVNHVVIPIGTAKAVRFLGQTQGSQSNTALSWALWNGSSYVDSSTVVYSQAYDPREAGETVNKPKEYYLEIGEYEAKGATHIAISVGSLTNSIFYCYLINGLTVIETIKDLPQIKAAYTIDLVSTIGGITIDGYNIVSGNWKSGDRRCVLIPVKDVLRIGVIGNPERPSHVGFLTNFPSNIADGVAVSELISNDLADSNVVTYFDVPVTAKYIYFNMEAGNGSYDPQKVWVVNRKDKLAIPASHVGEKYDTYIEENITDSLIYNNYKEKTYVIDHNATYCLIGDLPSSLSSHYLLKTYDINNDLIDNLYQGGSADANKVMEPITFAANVHHVILTYFLQAADSYTLTGCGALMRQLDDSDWIPTNNIIYCCSKVASKVMPYDYAETQTFQQDEEWSAWAFYMPYGYERSRHYGTKFPIATFFHGSSGIVTPDVLTYLSSNNYDSIQGMLRQKGFIVFDVNGYGISRESDNASHHWGNPASVETTKKAYEILVERFSGRRGMLLSGMSMGGALAKSYAMTYPEDVVACALEAPSELGGTCRIQTASGATAAAAWGYTNKESMYSDMNHEAFVGYSPCITPMIYDESGSARKIVQSSMTDFFIKEHINEFICAFPVEIKIWHGYNAVDDVDTDNNVPYFYSKFFVNTVRNSGGNATIRLCPNCDHYLNNYPWVKQEVVNYILDKMLI